MEAAVRRRFLLTDLDGSLPMARTPVMMKRNFLLLFRSPLLWWVGITLTSPLIGQMSIREGLVAEWNFDENSGQTASDSVGTNEGVLNDFPDDQSHWVEGKVGGGIAFDGVENYIEVPDHASIGADVRDALTVMAWFKSDVVLEGSGAGNRMLEKGNNYFFLQGVRPGGMNFLVKNGGANFTAGIDETLEADTWYHIAGVFDGATAKTYINGELKGSVDVPGRIDDNKLPLRIGSDDSGNFFAGVMDQVLIWKRALSGAEIRTVIEGSFEIVEGALPEIQTQPESQTLFEGGTASLQVTADGAGTLRYLWYKGEDPLRAETSPSLTIPDASANDSGEYWVRVQNESGEVASTRVTLSVTPVTGLATGRVASWSFDETSGSMAKDDSDSGLNGELVGFPNGAWQSGQVKNSLHFDGVGSVVAVGNHDALNSIGNEATISFWINLSSYGELESAGSYDRAASYILRKGNHLGVRIVNDPGTVTRTIAVRAGTGNDSGTVNRKGWEANAPQGSVELDVWHHFTIVYKGGEVLFYKNGFPVGTPATGGLGSPNEEGLNIGNYDDIETAVRYLNGNLDELNLWARPLREAEILEIAGKDVAGVPVVEVQPQSQKKLEGTTAVFQIVATGKRPVAYQWLKNGQAIEGATENRLTLSRLVPSDAGQYTVTVTNDQGSSNSEAGRLEVEELGAITSGLVAHFTFDELADGSLLDQTGNGLNGTLLNFGDGAIDAGVIGGAIAFDGEDDHIRIPHSDLLSLGTEATVSVWLNPVLFSGGSDFDRVFRKDVNYDFVLINGGVARVHGVSKTPYSAPRDTVVAESWQHFAYVVRNGTIQWYRNGEPVGRALRGKLGEPNSNPLVLGNYEVEPTQGNWINRPYQGLMDDLGIWQRALTANDLLSIYQNGLNGKPLSEELDPIEIQSVTRTENGLALRYFTPFSSRNHVVQSRSGAAEREWMEIEGLRPKDLGEGLFEVEVPAPGDGLGFYQIAAVPPPPIFFDDFESGAPGWTHGGAKDEWELGRPSNGPGAPASGDHVYGTDLDGDFEPFSEAFLRSPEIDLTEVSVANLRFSEFHSVDAEIDFHSVVVNVIDPKSNVVIQEVFRAAGATSGWTPRTIRLAGDAVGGVVKIEFLLITDEFNPLPGFYIDDVEVREN